MIVLGDLPKAGADDRPGCKIEGATKFSKGMGNRVVNGDLYGRQRKRGQIDRLLNELAWIAAEDRAEHLVPANDFVQGALERGDVQATAEPDSTGNVEEVTLRIQLMNQPQPLLRKRCGRRAAARALTNDGGAAGGRCGLATQAL